MDFDQMVEEYHKALAEFTKANPEPVKALWSQRDDASLASGMGGFTHGAKQVTKNLDFAADQFHEGRISFKTLSKYAADDFAYLVEIERYEAKLFGSDEMDVSTIRVTTIFRRENGVWKAVHRHGDSLPAVRAVLNAVPYSLVSIQKVI
ncbi:MAG: YybH family protein [Halobacteriota archaeon]